MIARPFETLPSTLDKPVQIDYQSEYELFWHMPFIDIPLLPRTGLVEIKRDASCKD